MPFLWCKYIGNDQRENKNNREISPPASARTDTVNSCSLTIKQSAGRWTIIRVVEEQVGKTYRTSRGAHRAARDLECVKPEGVGLEPSLRPMKQGTWSALREAHQEMSSMERRFWGVLIIVFSVCLFFVIRAIATDINGFLNGLVSLVLAVALARPLFTNVSWALSLLFLKPGIWLGRWAAKTFEGP